MEVLVENERRKLLANALDRISTACVTLGIIAPLAAATYGPSLLGLPAQFYLIGGGSWLLAGIALHLAGRLVLGGLKP